MPMNVIKSLVLKKSEKPVSQIYQNEDLAGPLADDEYEFTVSKSEFKSLTNFMDQDIEKEDIR